MSPIEIRPIPHYKWRMALIAFAAIVALYFYLGYLPVMVLICGGVLVVVLLYTAVRGESTEPCVILDDEGVFDKRLQLGVIRWEDIRRITLHDLEGAQYVSLELHNPETYAARQPTWLRLASKAQRLHRMSSTSISTSGLDVDTKTLAEMLHEGCETASQRQSEMTL